jgi:hypothetical protein
MKTSKRKLRLPFRATEARATWLCALLGTVGLLCLSAAGCAKTTGPVGASLSPADPAEPVPGIETTLPEHLPPNAVICAPKQSGRLTTAAVSDPAAPRITIGVPEGWSSAAGTGDTALTLAGHGLSAMVTISPTDLEPAGSFLRYTAKMVGAVERLKFSVTGAQFCGYSSQQLTMTVQGRYGAVDVADRITHVWTNTKSYLVAIHLEGPSGAVGFSAAKSALTQDFAVVIP